MSYAPRIDFLALLRRTADSVEFARMPGLDFVVAALARAGLFRLFTGQTAPIVNQNTTVWLKPALPSWTAEGVVFLWSAAAGAYVVATPDLWAALLSPSGYSFQLITQTANTVNVGTTIAAVQRVAPGATSLMLPKLNAQWTTGRPLRIVDWSSSIVEHAITLVTPDGATIMQRATFLLFSTPDQLSGVTLYPCPDLNGWVIAP